MRLHIKYLPVVACLIALSACSKNYLDKNPLDQIPASSFWKTQSDADLALAGIYNFLVIGNDATSVSSAGAGWGGGSMFWEAIADNGYTQSSGGSFGSISTGVIEATTGGMQSQAYTVSYQVIAACNNLLDNIGRIPMDTTTMNQYKAEAKFFRAYYYFLLTQLYGDCVLTLHTLNNSNASATLPRVAKAIVVDTILSDLSFAAAHLPNTTYNGHVVRATALGYEAKVLLANDAWQQSATIAQTIITEHRFSLFTGGYRNLFFRSGQTGNPEIMFSANYLPPNLYSPSDWLYSYLNVIQVLQPLVNDYECSDGLPITQSPLYNSAKPYVNRDPRLAATILVPGVWRGTTPNTAFNPATVPVPSGFLPKKGVDSTRFPTTYATQSDQSWVFMRYAEVLLMYAEAQNEAIGPDATVYAAIDSVRQRVGMPVLPAGLSQSAMRTRIQHERRIELAMEGQRYFDLKRWRLDRVLMPLVKDPTNAYRSFPLRDTLWPVPQSEVDIANGYGNKGFYQTPGWN
ncbi:RagB/SusD family nutrient uptake outer membrane protein [Puia dinghuensis]|uniref:Membrane protein n=1 Tax=Puia dinghuensis TaxID=1792502 RepID=A0A8J2U9V2_9BACT|nr:RagB/SusD family nutrient uptake outer membrane protein [Puia dinghuensis]GGA89470.1 membrane protein [Puia dinghuensis]